MRPDGAIGSPAARVRRPSIRRTRLPALVLAFVAIATSAVGPARVAAALGLSSRAALPAPGFLPEPTSVRVTAPTLRITGLSAILPDQPIPLAGGGRSPAGPVDPSGGGGTVLLQFQSIQLDDLAITQSAAGPFTLAIANAGSGERAAVIGGPGQTVDLWGVLHNLDLCLSTATLTSLAGGLPVVGGLLGTVTGLINGLVPATVSSAGPCFSLVSLVPILSALVRAGIPLPTTIPADNLVIDAYALHVTAPGGQTSLLLPTGNVVVNDR